MGLELVKRAVRLEAARLLEAEGWVQGWYRGPDGERCLDQALADAAAVIECPEHPQEVLNAIRADLWHELGESVIGWNVEAGRTLAEVVAALRARA